MKRGRVGDSAWFRLDPQEAKCDVCGEKFTSYMHPNGLRQRYCSPKHRQYAANTRMLKKMKDKTKGGS